MTVEDGMVMVSPDNVLSDHPTRGGTEQDICWEVPLGGPKLDSGFCEPAVEGF